ncbi:CC142 protein, partial [Syrrhaptes paradoxus]|nr:CC142 protein [Syrrhaptes paradoxus]
PPGGPCPRLQVLGRCLALAHAACAWVTASARRFLAAWTLPQLLIVTQGDLQVRGRDPRVGGDLQVRGRDPRVGGDLQVRGQDPRVGGTCLGGQTPPRLMAPPPSPAQPSSPSAYARSAAQTVLGQVLQGARLLPRDAQAPTLARATTAFGEAWMDHILARRIKFR